MDFRFLKETPQTDDSSLDFGHKEIVATLNEIICKEDQNLTIGLFGGWGSGKSSIVESLKKSLKQSNVPLVVFDVWKHEGDALRRTFLTELVTRLDSDYGESYFKKNYKHNQRLKFSQNSSKEIFSVKWDRLKVHFPLLLTLGVIFLFMLLILSGLLSLLEVELFSHVRGKEIVIGASTVLSASLIYKYVDYFIKVEKAEYKEERFQDPHEFEQEFSHIIDNLCAETKKIVVTFDNLDRVSGDNALKIIATIKTFLDYSSKEDEAKKTVYFLIPCDVVSMKEHISIVASAGDKNEAKEIYWDEFLRKFFNTSIWIPEFYPTELEKFAVAKLQEVNLEEFNNDSLSWLIIRVFSRNPRQVIQFINILLANYLLLKQFCENGAFHDREFYKNNVPQLAKFLLIKQRHSSCLDQYGEKFIYDLSDIDMLAQIKDDKFKNLLIQTDDIYIPTLEPYFNYRLSKAEQENQAIVQFIAAVVNGDENAKETLEKIDYEFSAEAFNNIIRLKMRGISNVLIKSALVNQVLDLLIINKLKARNALFRELILFFSGSNDWSVFYRIEPIKVFHGILQKASNLTPPERQSIINGFLNTLIENDTAKNNFSDIVRHAQLGHVFRFAASYDRKFSDSQLSLIRTCLEEKYEHNSILDIFFTNEELQLEFISQKYINTVFDNFKPDLSLQISSYLLLLMNAFWPRIVYFERITHMLFLNFHFIFNEDLLAKSPILLEKYGQQIEIHLARRTYGKHRKTEDVMLDGLLKKMTQFLHGQTADTIFDNLSLLMVISKFERFDRTVIDIINSMLAQSDSVLLEKILDEYVTHLEHEYGRDIQVELVAAIVKFHELRYTISSLPIRIVSVLVVKYMEVGDIAFAKQLLEQYLSQWDLQMRTEMIKAMAMLFSVEQLQGKLGGTVREYMDLIISAAEQDRKKLADSGLWAQLIGMLITHAIVPIRAPAASAIEWYFELILPNKITDLIRQMILGLRTEQFDSDELFHKPFVLLLIGHSSNEYKLEYLNFVFRKLLLQSLPAKVLGIWAMAIEKLVYDPGLITDEMVAYLDYYQQLDEDGKMQSRIIVQAMLTKLQNCRSKTLKDLKAKINKLIKKENRDALKKLHNVRN